MQYPFHYCSLHGHKKDKTQNKNKNPACWVRTSVCTCTIELKSIPLNHSGNASYADFKFNIILERELTHSGPRGSIMLMSLGHGLRY